MPFPFFGRNREVDMLEAKLENMQRDMSAMRNQSASWDKGWEALSQMLDGVSSANAAGMPVTQDTAMRVSAVYACVRLIAGAIGSLPLQVYRRTTEGRERADTHQAYDLLHAQPNPMLTSVVYWETVMGHVLLEGNHYSLIGRDRGGSAISLTPLKPHRVEPEVRNGRMIYLVQFDDGKWYAYDQDDILHIPGIGWDGKRGLSVIGYAGQNAIGTAMAADQYSGKFFANDQTPRGYIKFPSDKNLTREQADFIRDYWYKRHAGIDNSHLPAFIPNGGEFHEISMSARDSQMIESRKFQVIDIARIFGVPPYMIGESEKSSSWGSGIEQQGIGFVQYTLRPHLARIEQEVRRKLFGGTEYFCEFSVDGLMRGDIKGRHEAYQIALGGNQQPGWMTVNEVRRLENKPKIEGGDTLYVPMTGDSNAPETTEPDSGQPTGEA